MNAAPGPANGRDARLASLIAGLVAELEPLERGRNAEEWLANTTGEARHESESARLETEIRKLYARAEPYRLLRELAEGGPLADPHAQRQLTLLLDAHRAHQIAPEMIERMVRISKGLESRFNNYRATVDGAIFTDNQLRAVLRDSNDSDERKRAWEAAKQIGQQVVGDLRELVLLRNQAAREVGFENYYSMMLTLDELDEAELFGLLDELERGTHPLFERYKRDLDQRLSSRFGVPVEDLRPWHMSDPFFQEAPTAEVDLDPWFRGKSLERLTESFFGAIGFEVEDLLEHSDLYERPGKCQHAFCVSMDRGADVRVLCNNREDEYWMGTMLHEFGHAVYFKWIDRSLPYLLRDVAHTLTTEAIAMLFGRLSKSPAWLKAYAGADAGEAERQGEALARARREQLLVQTRWCLVMSHMERALYRDPGQDLDTLWWDLVERFQGVRRPDGRHAPDWASKIHFCVAPVYYHNYMLGEIMASQLQRHILREVVGGGPGEWDRYVASPAVGGFLRDRLFRLGKSVDWRGAIRHATGESLGPVAFVKELSGES